MISAQIERLKKDSRDLENYARKLRKKGKLELATKVLARQTYLDDHIADLKKVS